MKKQNAFTIVEVMTSVVIIAILVAVLLPAVGQVRKFARKVRQKAQLTAMSTGVELFKNDFGKYPDSSRFDKDDQEYNGAQKLAEALLGQDLLGVHPSVATKFDKLGENDVYEKDGTEKTDQPLYTADTGVTGYNSKWQDDVVNRTCRKGPYLEAEKANAVELDFLYDSFNNLEPLRHVLVDSYAKKNSDYKDELQDYYENTLKIDKVAPSKVGMPILYFKANTQKIFQVNAGASNDGTNSERIYNWMDNKDIAELLPHWDGFVDVQPSEYFGDSADTYDGDNRDIFADMIVNPKLSVPSGGNTRLMPYNARGFILVSAGEDGFYGTEDDVFNFEKEK